MISFLKHYSYLIFFITSDRMSSICVVHMRTGGIQWPPPSIPNEILCVHPWTQNIQPLRCLMSSWVKHPYRGWETACHHAPSLPPVPTCLQPLLYGCFWDFQGAVWQRCLFQGRASTEHSLHLPLSPVMNLCNNQHPLQKRASLNKALLDARQWAWRWILRRQWKGASLLSKTKMVLSAYDLHSHEHLTRFTGGEQNSLLASGATNLHRMRLVTPTTAIITAEHTVLLRTVQGRWEVWWQR